MGLNQEILCSNLTFPTVLTLGMTDYKQVNYLLNRLLDLLVCNYDKDIISHQIRRSFTAEVGFQTTGSCAINHKNFPSTDRHNRTLYKAKIGRAVLKIANLAVVQ